MLWQPPPGVAGIPIEVDSVLTKWLRPHQRDGVQFMFECVMGLRQKCGTGAGLRRKCTHAWIVCNRMTAIVLLVTRICAMPCRVHFGG